MATYESVIASLLQSRIAQGNSDTSFGIIFDARAAEAIWPGTLELSASGMTIIAQGKDAGIAVRAFLKANGFGIVAYPVVQEAAGGTGTFPATNAPGWVRTKFGANAWPAAPMYSEAVAGLRGLVMGKIFTTIKSVPNDLQKIINQLFIIGLMVYPANADAQWLTEGDRAAFVDIVAATKPVVGAYHKSRLADLAIEGAALQSNADLWNNVYRITAAVATLGLSEVGRKIDEMKTKLREFAAAKKKALAAADQMNMFDRLDVYTKVAAEEAKIKTSLGALYSYVPGLDADLKGDGLGVWQIAGGVAATVVIAKITLVIMACGAAVYLLFKLTGVTAGFLDTFGGGIKAVGGIAGIAVVGVGLFFLYKYGKKKLA